MNTIAERIKFAMKAKNKKQVDIVKDTGISKGAFSSYLSGQYNPKADKLELIADSLDVDLRWLYGKMYLWKMLKKMILPCNMSFTTTPAPSIFLMI